jgi:hypothetical protein
MISVITKGIGSVSTCMTSVITKKNRISKYM